jgi:methionine salvage enolase-phosphatase E1
MLPKNRSNQTTACLYLQDILFPYIRDQLEDYLSTHWEEDECKQDVHLLKKQVELLERRASHINYSPATMANGGWTLIIHNINKN